MSLVLLGNLELAEGDRNGAKGHYLAALKLCQQARRKFGNSQRALRDEAGSLVQLGDVEQEEDDRAKAKVRYVAALSLCQQWCKQFGDNFEARSVKIWIHLKLSLVASAKKEAVTHFESALALFGLLIEHHGQTPGLARDYLQVAQVYIEWCEKSGQPQKAKPVREWLDGLKSAQP